MDASTKADLEKECNAWNSNLESSHSEMHTAHVRAYAGLGMVPLPRGGAGGKIRKDRSSRNVRKKANRLGVSRRKNKHELVEAVGDGDLEKVRELLEAGTDVNIPDDKQRSALHVCCTKNDHEILKLLIKHKADLNIRDTRGNTPLHLAACTNNTSIITEMLQAGCDSTAKDSRGKTPFDYAHSHLQLMGRNKSQPDFAVRKKIGEVVEMLQTFMRINGDSRVDEMDMLAERLRKTSTRAEVDVIAGLLEGFTSMAIQGGKAGGAAARAPPAAMVVAGARNPASAPIDFQFLTWQGGSTKL